MNKIIRSFKDLRVYNDSYTTMIQIHKSLLNKLPNFEKYDLVRQLSRSSKAIPRLIAEGYGKRQQRLGFQKYLYDAIGETHESMASLEQCRDIYNVDSLLVNKLIEDYDKISRQLYCLKIAWDRSKKKKYG
jgi:four helix bundle protein